MARSERRGDRQAIGLVAGREIRERLRAKSFYVGTGVLVVIILAIGVVSRIAGEDDGPRTVDVGLVGATSDPVATALEHQPEGSDLEITVTAYSDDDAARAAVEAEDVDVAVLPDAREVVFHGSVDDTVLTAVQQAWAGAEVQQALQQAGLSAEQATQALSVPPLDAVTVDDDGLSGIAVLTGTMAAVLLFLSIQTFGTYVLTGVVEEKATAVVEVVLVRASAEQLLAGKVIGIGVAAMAQFALAVLAGLGALAISGRSIPSEIWSSVPMTLVWFLGGYAFYSTLFALAGSLVSRQEDAQSAAAPITYGLIAAYMLIFLFGYVPDSLASTILSLIPPITPLLMPMRMAAGAAPVWQVLLALALLLGATWAVWRLSGRIYQQVLLRRGSRVTWKDATGLLRTR